LDDGNCLSKEFENYGHRLESLDWGLHNIIDIYICILHFIQADDWSGDFSQIQRGIWVGNVGAIMALEYVHVIIGNVCRHTCRKGCVFDKKQAKVLKVTSCACDQALFSAYVHINFVYDLHCCWEKSPTVICACVVRICNVHECFSIAYFILKYTK